uniref:Cyclic nucleotide-binding domain-containing protein n=1 Tax=Heterosigma akashiwo TaxID=2829 RepID=A0A7S3XYQ8_HETAK|mmetsp:Transcript_7729/g.12076  ORF Transcript_7729/g.12076 Transcript_7729/m.12076 type:complete len:429 (+) Transcript_7729:383-1669(+)
MKVTPALRKRILGYFEYVWEIGSSSYNHQVYERLPPKLGLELRLNLKREFVRGCPLLAVFTGPAVVALVESMEAIIVLPNDPIVQQGQNVTQLFLINRGRCTVSHMSNGSFALTGSTKGKANPLTSNNTKRRLRRRFSNSTRLASAEEVHYTQSFISKSGKFAGSSRNNSVNGDSSGILHVLKTLHCGAHFGDHQVLGLEELSSVSIVSDGFGEIQVVPGEVLVNVLGDDPLLKATVRRISQSTLEAQQRLLRNLSNAKLVLHHLSERKTQNPLKRMASMHHSMKTGRRRGNGALHKNGERRSKRWSILGNTAKITASDVDRIRKSQVAALDKLFHHRVTLNPHFVPVFRHRHDDALKEEISYHIAEGPSRAPSPAASRKLSRAATPYIAVNGSSLSLLSDSIHEEEETKKSGQTRRLLLQEATSMSP